MYIRLLITLNQTFLLKVCSAEDEAAWSSQLESTRKDVERAFGILKGRFRCLKLPCLIQTMEALNYVFKCCVMLHNIILTADGRDKLWESDVDWNGGDGHHDLNDPEWSMTILHRNILKKRSLSKLTDLSGVGRRVVLTVRDEEADEGFYTLRRELVNHYYYQFTHNQVEWLN